MINKKKIKSCIKLCVVLLFGLFRAVDKFIAKNNGRQRILLHAGTGGAIAIHIAEFAETIAPKIENVDYYCFSNKKTRTQYGKSFSRIPVTFITSKLRLYSTYFDVIISGHGYSSLFREGSTKLLDINHGGHIIGINNGDDTVFYSQCKQYKPDIILEANRHKVQSVIRDYPDLNNVVKWSGWKFAEKEIDAVKNRELIREQLGFNKNDIVLFIVGTWGPFNLYHTYGDHIFDVIKELAKSYKVILSDHYNDYKDTVYFNGMKARAKGQLVDGMRDYGCVVRPFDDSWIEYMAAADVVFTDYSTLSEEAVAMGKKVIFSNYPDEAVWKHSICYRARKYLPVVKDIEQLEEYIIEALNMELPIEIKDMAQETYLTREEYEHNVLTAVESLLS